MIQATMFLKKTGEKGTNGRKKGQATKTRRRRGDPKLTNSKWCPFGWVKWGKARGEKRFARG